MSDTLRQYWSGALDVAYARDGYTWGGETPHGADCSGTVAWALHCAGFEYRVTAHEFYYKVFFNVYENPEQHYYPEHPSVIALLTADRSRTLGGNGEMLPLVEHMAPVIPGGLCVDANYSKDEIEVITLQDFIATYRRDDTWVRLSYATFDVLEEHSGAWLYGLDSNWTELAK